MLALLTCTIGLVVAIAAAAVPRGTNGKILIGRADSSVGQEQVYTVDPDGTDLSLLANDAEATQWSPEGSRIAIGLACCGGGILDFDTGSFTSLNLDTLYPDRFLGCGVWSPEGDRLTCEGLSETDPTLNGVYTVRASDGADLQRITSNPGGDDCPSDYSPNGKQIVLTRASETVYALFTVKLDGSGMRRITPPGMNFNFCNGSWSPQGNEILFSAHVPSDEHSTIWVVHADGTGLRQIPVPGCGGPDSSPTWVGCFNPSWSPDGKKIVFGRQPATTLQRDVYTVNADGSGLFRVTNTPDVEEFHVDWGTHTLTP